MTSHPRSRTPADRSMRRSHGAARYTASMTTKTAISRTTAPTAFHSSRRGEGGRTAEPSAFSIVSDSIASIRPPRGRRRKDRSPAGRAARRVLGRYRERRALPSPFRDERIDGRFGSAGRGARQIHERGGTPSRTRQRTEAGGSAPSFAADDGDGTAVGVR